MNLRKQAVFLVDDRLFNLKTEANPTHQKKHRSCEGGHQSLSLFLFLSLSSSFSLPPLSPSFSTLFFTLLPQRFFAKQCACVCLLSVLVRGVPVTPPSTTTTHGTFAIDRASSKSRGCARFIFSTKSNPLAGFPWLRSIIIMHHIARCFGCPLSKCKNPVFPTEGCHPSITRARASAPKQQRH